MATVRKIAPINSAFLFIYELKTQPQEKFLFPDSLVCYSETANAELSRSRRGGSAARNHWNDYQ
jgi:hypothetical protein